MSFQSRILGSTGLSVGPIGVSSSYGMPAAAVEEAFDRGMNYLYWGSLRRDSFAQGVRNRLAHRSRMVLVVQSFSRFPKLIEWSVDRALKRLGTDYADVLLLGYWNQPVPARVLDASMAVKEKGKVRYLALSTHQTPLAGEMARGGPFDVVHFRYNAKDREAERDILSAAPKQRPGLVAYTATCWSRLLSAKIPGERTPAAGDCYRFVLSHPSVDLCMNGAASVEEARHALASVEKGPMDPDEMAWMRRVGDALG